MEHNLNFIEDGLIEFADAITIRIERLMTMTIFFHKPIHATLMKLEN